MSHGSEAKREQIEKLFPYRHLKKDYCEECGQGKEIRDENGYLVTKFRGAKGLTVHHIDEDPTNNDPGNLQTLCRKCHDRKHIKD